MSLPTDRRTRARERRMARAAADFSQRAFLHAQARSELLRRLEPLALAPQQILDLGGGPGLGSRALVERYRKAKVTLIDQSEAMLTRATGIRGWWRRFECVHAEATALPVADASIDLIVAGMLLPNLPDPTALFQEVRRVLKPRGYFVFTTLGAPTMQEVRAAYASADEVEHIYDFKDFHDLGDALSQAGFVAPVLDADRLTITYQSLSDVCRDLRASAAALPVTGRTSLTGARRWRAAEQAFLQERQVDGRVPVTCEIIYGQAWAPDAEASRRRGPAADVVVPLTTLRRHS